ncbi:hypothetical protein ACE1B6_23465 [Aerosakkonemataceae cyanobacterium BLCC-F154]|uniref:Uncharacterized protein n=1 Tax=Floridaenema fluviatile BLCC-F154 TaxID=3153640 RepID=A0ABV4YHH3_9CYAN
MKNKAEDDRQKNAKYKSEHIPTTEEGNTPLDERSRMTGQESGTDVRSGAEPEAPGGDVKVVGGPNQGTDSR